MAQLASHVALFITFMSPNSNAISYCLLTSKNIVDSRNTVSVASERIHIKYCFKYTMTGIPHFIMQEHQVALRSAN